MAKQQLKENRPKGIAYLLVLVPTLVLIALFSKLPPLLSQTPAIIYYLIVLLAVWPGGFVPVLISTFILFFYAIFFIRPSLIHDPMGDLPYVIRAMVFLGTNLIFLLLNAALERALKKAQDALSLRDEFLTMASHELRTPLPTLYLQMG